MDFLKYLKPAFLFRWNLLGFLGGVGFALLSGHPDIVGSLVLAAEVGYLGLLGTHPKFQKYVDAQQAQAARRDQGADAEQALRGILRALPRESLQKFEALKARCLELRQIALDMRQPGRTTDPTGLESLQLAGLDRLLWIYLKLLFTEHSLRRFFEKTQEPKLVAEVNRAETRLKETEATPPGPQRDRLLHALRDNLETCRERVANYRKAAENHQFVQLETERLENKIRSISEAAVNRHEPEFISGQVDQVAHSMLDTERAINELDFVTGLGTREEEIPGLVRRDVAVES